MGGKGEEENDGEKFAHDVSFNDQIYRNIWCCVLFSHALKRPQPDNVVRN